MNGGQTPETGATPEASTKEIMIEVMNKLGEKRKEIGVLSLGTNPDDPNQRVDFFIAPVEAENGKSMEDGGSMDIVFASPEGFFAIRHSGTVEGKNAFVKLKADLLRGCGDTGKTTSLTSLRGQAMENLKPTVTALNFLKILKEGIP